MRHPVWKWVGVLSSLLALAMTLETHWYLLQSVAWARMLIQYSRSESLSQALQKTFDGQHPCSLCLKVRHGQQQQEREQQNFPSTRTELTSDLFCQHDPICAPLPPLVCTDAVPFVPECSPGLLSAPLKPPPRSEPQV